MSSQKPFTITTEINAHKLSSKNLLTFPTSYHITSMWPVPHPLVILYVTTRAFLSAALELGPLTETCGNLEATVLFPVRPALLTQPALHVRGTPGVPLCRHSN